MVVVVVAGRPGHQDSAIGPASYVVNAADLTTVTAGSLIFKYADDTYIVISVSISVSSRVAELDHVMSGQKVTI